MDQANVISRVVLSLLLESENDVRDNMDWGDRQTHDVIFISPPGLFIRSHLCQQHATSYHSTSARKLIMLLEIARGVDYM